MEWDYSDYSSLDHRFSLWCSLNLCDDEEVVLIVAKVRKKRLELHVINFIL